MSPADNLTNSHILAEWLAAIGSIAVAVVAIFQEWFRRLVFRPNLKLSAHVGRPAAEKFKWEEIDTDVYYFRLEVTNEGSAAAETLQVYVAGVKRRRKDGIYEEVSRFSPMNLVWAYTKREPTLPLLLAGMPPRLCDFAHISDPRKRSQTNESLPGIGPEEAALALELEVQPNSLTYLLEPGTYRLSLKLVASNHSPRDYILEVEFPGKWFDEPEKMFRDGFGLGLVESK
jgi:hypothetical protein